MNTEAKKQLPEKLVIEREKIVLKEKNGISIFSCIGFGCSSIFILIILTILAFVALPSFREETTKFGLSLLADQFKNREIPEVKVNPTLLFVDEIDRTKDNALILNEVKITQDEFNSYLEKYLENYKLQNTNESLQARVLLKENSAIIYLRLKDKKTPWLEIYLNNQAGKYKFEKAVLGPLTLDSANLKSTISNLNLGVENIDFEQIDQLLALIILGAESEYKIDKIQTYDGYMQVRLIRK